MKSIKPFAVVKYRITDHARLEMERRGISAAELGRVLSAPEQCLEARPDRFIFQSRVEREDGRSCLLRVFVDINREPAMIVTAYQTTKVDKYWEDEA